jgi:hypothetical protein
MMSEHAVVFDSNNVICIILVILFQMKKNLELNSSLMLILLIVPDDLDRYCLSSFVVQAFQSLSKTTLSKEGNHFKPVGNMILDNHIVVTSLIIEAIVILQVFRTLYLFSTYAQEVTFFVVENFTLFILCKSWNLEEVAKNLGTR